MEDEPEIKADACPRCGTPVQGERFFGRCSGARLGPDGKVVALLNHVYLAVCKNCLADLEAWTNEKYAQAREFYWEMRELGPRPSPRPSYPDEKRRRESVLAPLLQIHADRAQVMDDLGLNLTDFSVGSSQRAELTKWLFFDEVKQAAGRYPGIFSHLGDLTMTWLFFDADNRLQGCFIRPT
jgi:hypothetical protein